jgi:hypothetical protein
MPFNVATFPDSFRRQVLDTIVTRLAGIVTTSGPTNTARFGTQYQLMLTLMTVTLTFEPEEISMCIHDRVGVLAQYLLMDSLGTHGTLIHRGASFTFRKRLTCWIYTITNESEARNFRNALFLAMQLADDADRLDPM